VGKIATVEVTPGQAETLGVARRLDSLSLALRSLVANNTVQSDDDPARLGKGEAITTGA
jgi:Flp pilus assembly protein CpaB